MENLEGDDFSDVPVTALRRTARNILSLHLNPPRMVTSPCGVIGDWRGVAELRNFQYLQIVNFERHTDPTSKLLEEWNSLPGEDNSVGSIIAILKALARYDVLAEIKPHLVSTSSGVTGEHPSDHHVDESRFIVTEDTEDTIATFDAFVCFCGDRSAKKDWKFIREMIATLENEPYNLRLYIMQRNLLPGTSVLNVSAKLIEERCRRTIVILSKAYLDSPECEFHTRYALCLSPSAHSKKILPIKIEPECPIPSVLRPLTIIDHTRDDIFEWFWDKIAQALKKPLSLTTEDRTIKKEISTVQYTLSKRPSIDILK